MPCVKCNMHTHTQFCDGQNSMEEMVVAALQKGFATLGFSPHSYTPFDLEYCVKDFAAEQKEFFRLKQKYGDKICLLNGIELDLYGQKPSDAKLDFVIGSVHYLKDEKGRFYAVDESREAFDNMVAECFGGDVLKAAERYYDAAANMVSRLNPDIIGHFDLISLYGDFSACVAEYREIATAAVDKIKNCGAVVEVNCGRLFKGKGGLYPADFLLRYMAKNNFDFTLSSDAHCVDALGYRFDQTAEKLKNIGIKRLAVFDENGRTFVGL